MRHRLLLLQNAISNGLRSYALRAPLRRPLLTPRSCATKPLGSNPGWWKPGGHVTGAPHGRRVWDHFHLEFELLAFRRGALLKCRRHQGSICVRVDKSFFVQHPARHKRRRCRGCSMYQEAYSWRRHILLPNPPPQICDPSFRRLGSLDKCGRAPVAQRQIQATLRATTSYSFSSTSTLIPMAVIRDSPI